MERNNPKFVNTEYLGGGIFPSKNTIINIDEYFESRMEKNHISLNIEELVRGKFPPRNRLEATPYIGGNSPNEKAR